MYLVKFGVKGTAGILVDAATSKEAMAKVKRMDRTQDLFDTFKVDQTSIPYAAVLQAPLAEKGGGQ